MIIFLACVLNKQSMQGMKKDHAKSEMEKTDLEYYRPFCTVPV